jgi:hypothetical protein
MFFWVRGYVFLYEGPIISGVGGYVFGGPLKTAVSTPLKKRGQGLARARAASSAL